jgi:hypothetical protein
MQDVIFPTRVTHTRVTLEGEPRWTQRSNKPSGKPGHGQLRSLRARSNRAPLRSNALRRVVGALPLSSWWESARGTTRPPVHIPPTQPSRLFLSALAPPPRPCQTPTHLSQFLRRPPRGPSLTIPTTRHRLLQQRRTSALRCQGARRDEGRLHCRSRRELSVPSPPAAASPPTPLVALVILFPSRPAGRYVTIAAGMHSVSRAAAGGLGEAYLVIRCCRRCVSVSTSNRHLCVYHHLISSDLLGTVL